MFKTRPAAEVSTVLEEAAVAFDRCLQALKVGDAQTIRRPRPGMPAPAGNRSDL